MQNVLDALIKLVQYLHANSMNHPFMNLLKEIDDLFNEHLFFANCHLSIRRVYENVWNKRNAWQIFNIQKNIVM